MDRLRELFGIERAPIMPAAGGAMAATAASAAHKQMALYIAAGYLSAALSKCEWRTYENGERVEDELYYALNVSPNPNQNAPAMAAKIVEQCIYNGHALMFQPNPSKNSFYVADSFTVEEHPFGEDSFTGIRVGNETLDHHVPASKACRFRIDNEFEVHRLVNSMYADMGTVLGMAMESYRQASGDKYILERDFGERGDRSAQSADQEEANDRLMRFLKGTNGVIPMYRGQRLVRLQPKTTGAGTASDIIALRKDVFEVTAQALKIPLSMMYGNMTNAKDVVTQFVTFGVDHWARMISVEATRKFFSYAQWRKGCRIDVDTSKISHLDMFEVADKAERLISSGACSIDEVRIPMGLDVIDDEFSTAHWMTKNYELIQNALKRIDGDVAGGGEQQ